MCMVAEVRIKSTKEGIADNGPDSGTGEFKMARVCLDMDLVTVSEGSATLHLIPLLEDEEDADDELESIIVPVQLYDAERSWWRMSEGDCFK